MAWKAVSLDLELGFEPTGWFHRAEWQLDECIGLQGFPVSRVVGFRLAAGDGHGQQAGDQKRCTHQSMFLMVFPRVKNRQFGRITDCLDLVNGA